MFVQGEYEGVGHATRTIHKGIRSTSADFIRHYEKTNLTVKASVYVDRIILEHHDVNSYKAVGVEAYADTNGQPIIIKARKEIIVSVGVYNSPLLLMHSGIGPAEHLIEMGIHCKVNLPDVEKNLQDHLIVHMPYQIKDVNFTLDRFMYWYPDSLAVATKQWQDTKTGPMVTIPFGPFSLKRIDKTTQDPVWVAAKAEQQNIRPSVTDPTGQWPNQPHIELWTTERYFGVIDFLKPDGLPCSLAEGEAAITLLVFLCGLRGRGTVRLSSKDPTSKPIIDHAYLEDELDVAVFAESCRIGHEVITNGRGTKDIVIGPWPTTISYPTDLAGWKQHIRNNAGTCFHPSGTCKIAPDIDPMDVADNRLRMRNIEGLRVADVSILSLITNSHTQVPAYAIGEKVAHMILQDAVVEN
ncbi:unnamed protein product [Rotaria sp. Silwood1]|nr:unnamed protein product [Rotaria sp. Silwood1]CAF4857772.1 unnamed protein product [Rotaria sp. Silwood1]